MGCPVAWARQVLVDLDEIDRLVEPVSPFYAQAVVWRIVKVAGSIGDHPGMDRQVPEFRLDSIRERIVYSYRLIYRRLSQLIEVIAVIHGRRDLKPVAKRHP